MRCFQWFKDTNLKANHNHQPIAEEQPVVVSNGSKILIWKQITTSIRLERFNKCCFQWFKDTNLKANHNFIFIKDLWGQVVSNGSKILIWKQITTYTYLWQWTYCCFQWFKDTNLKANHNGFHAGHKVTKVVSNGSKILIWKQITTNTKKAKKWLQLFPMVQRY